VEYFLGPLRKLIQKKNFPTTPPEVPGSFRAWTPVKKWFLNTRQKIFTPKIIKIQKSEIFKIISLNVSFRHSKNHCFHIWEENILKFIKKKKL
jgi:hypothetical protein